MPRWEEQGAGQSHARAGVSGGWRDLRSTLLGCLLWLLVCGCCAPQQALIASRAKLGSSEAIGILAGGCKPWSRLSRPLGLSFSEHRLSHRIPTPGLMGWKYCKCSPFSVGFHPPPMFVSFHVGLWPRRAVPRHKSQAHPEGGGSKAPSTRRNTGMESKHGGRERGGGFACGSG